MAGIKGMRSEKKYFSRSKLMNFCEEKFFFYPGVAVPNKQVSTSSSFSSIKLTRRGRAAKIREHPQVEAMKILFANLFLMLLLFETVKNRSIEMKTKPKREAKCGTKRIRYILLRVFRSISSGTCVQDSRGAYGSHLKPF